MLKLPPSEFYLATVEEVAGILNASRRADEEAYHLSLLASYNAIGYFKVKNFDAIEPFAGEGESNKGYTKEEAEETLSFLSQLAEKNR